MAFPNAEFVDGELPMRNRATDQDGRRGLAANGPTAVAGRRKPGIAAAVLAEVAARGLTEQTLGGCAVLEGDVARWRG